MLPGCDTNVPRKKCRERLKASAKWGGTVIATKNHPAAVLFRGGGQGDNTFELSKYVGGDAASSRRIPAMMSSYPMMTVASLKSGTPIQSPDFVHQHTVQVDETLPSAESARANANA